MSRAVVLAASLALVAALGAAPASSPFIDVTVHEGTSMSVAVSPDGRMLAIDMQGSIWTLPSSGGPAKRITDLFHHARQPTWPPHRRTITFFACRDGCGAESFDVARSCRFAVVGSRRPDRVQRRAAAREPARSRWQSADRRRERLCVQAVIHSRVVSQRVLLRL